MTVGGFWFPCGGMSALLRVLLEEIRSKSEFVDRQTAVRPLRVVYADHSRLGHHDIAAGSVTTALMGRFEQGYRARWKRRGELGACGPTRSRGLWDETGLTPNPTLAGMRRRLGR